MKSTVDNISLKVERVLSKMIKEKRLNLSEMKPRPPRPAKERVTDVALAHGEPDNVRITRCNSTLNMLINDLMHEEGMPEWLDNWATINGIDLDAMDDSMMEGVLSKMIREMKEAKPTSLPQPKNHKHTLYKLMQDLMHEEGMTEWLEDWAKKNGIDLASGFRDWYRGDDSMMEGGKKNYTIPDYPPKERTLPDGTRVWEEDPRVVAAINKAASKPKPKTKDTKKMQEDRRREMMTRNIARLLEKELLRAI